MTNERRIKTMDTKELAKFLSDRGLCYGICAYWAECEPPHAQEFCIEQICRWLESEVEE